MQHFPIFMALTGRRVVVSGGDEAAIAKLRLLLKSEADIHVFDTSPAEDVQKLAQDGLITLHRREVAANDLRSAALAYGATEDDARDAQLADLARAAQVPFNIVDNLHDSQFITPAIVDRDPVTIAIGTEGAAPVLARAIKADLEARLPSKLGTLARIGKAFRAMADSLPMGRPRRDFWREYYFKTGPQSYEKNGVSGVEEGLDTLLTRHLNRSARPGHVAFIGAGPGDPELLTLKARRLLDEADVVLFDKLITPEILELARREALMIDVGKTAFGPSTPQSDINDLLVKHGAAGAQVVRLKSGDATVFGRLDEEIDAIEAHDIAYSIVPGITAASASVAAIGQSLTRRGRNASVRLLTGHDMQGFADHDWSSLARDGAVAAIYMGKASARFIQGRLIMHGAARATPITLIENASRADQRIIDATLDNLPKVLDSAQMKGPVLTLFGLAPREAAIALPDITQEFA